MKSIKLVLAFVSALVVVLVAAHTVSAGDFRPRGGFHDRARDAVALGIITKLNAQTIDATFDDYYAPNVTFIDPRSTVQGAAALMNEFKTQYSQIELHSIVATDLVRDGETRVVTWELTTQLKIAGQLIGQKFVYKGTSVLKFDCSDKVVYHRDYYDQFPLYQQIPGFDAAVGGILGQWIGTQLGGAPPAPAP